MAKLPSQCPSCASPLAVSRLGCASCGTVLEGDFPLPLLLALPEDDLRFVLEFVQASGSLKEMAKIRGLSYPTVRNRLDEIIQKLRKNPGPEERRLEVLDAIAQGRVSVKDAVQMLKGIAP